jgi:hypothetical protein
LEGTESAGGDGQTGQSVSDGIVDLDDEEDEDDEQGFT